MVNGAERLFVGPVLPGARLSSRAMIEPFIASRAALADACNLIDAHGEDASFEAALRAERARDGGNVLRFCYWRQIERVIVTLSSQAPQGTVH